MINIFENIEGMEVHYPSQKVVCFSGTSGVGKTTLVVNVAAGIKKNSVYGPKICIVDFNLDCPSVSYHFDPVYVKESKYTVVDFLEEWSNKGTDFEKVLEKVVSIHEPTGIHIINNISGNPPFNSPLMRDSYKYKYEELSKFIAQLKRCYDLVLIDTSSDVRKDITTSALIQSDAIYFVSNPNVPSILHTKNILNVFEVLDRHLGLEGSQKILNKIEIVVNRFNEKRGISKETISQSFLDKPISFCIEENNNLTTMLNSGSLAIESREEISISLTNLARSIYPFDRMGTEKTIVVNKDKESWVKLYGTEHLKNCIAYGYNSQRLYVEERWKMEFPDFLLDFSNEAVFKSRSCPTEEALKIEMDLRKKYGDFFDIRVVWLTKPPYKANADWSEKEAVVIKNYLEKYTLIKEID